MTEEEKKLLLKDLCTRELYHPMIRVFNDGYEGFQNGEFDTNLWFHHIDAFRFDRIEILPYLRSMSSMTDDEMYEVVKLIHAVEEPESLQMLLSLFLQSIEGYDWLNKHHFDYRGLIEKGLALEAPEDMYKID